MSDNVRFHSKWHGKNHHTLPTPGYYDSARDPIAGPGQEFMGDFYLSGAFVAITTPELSATPELVPAANATVSPTTEQANESASNTTTT